MTKRKEPQRIIALGASAGGIEALYSFFDHTPLDQVSYVVIQHMSADHQSRLAELLKKHSQLQICVAENEMPVEANRVYVIPHQAYLTIRKGRLQLTGKSSQESPHMTIDTFFGSLAADQGAKAIGIILSGTGKDGSEGIQAIRKAGGWVMVQDPATAKFETMPRNAIATGWASTVLAPEAMPGVIQAFVHHPPAAGPVSPFLAGGHPAPVKQSLTSGPAFQLINKDHNPPEEQDPTRHPAFQLMEGDDKERMSEPEERAMVAILDFIKGELPLDFSDYKRPTIFRRIRRRMALQQLSDADAYLNYLKGNPLELPALAKDFLISVTAFFRDARAFETIERNIIPAIVGTGSDPLKIWVAGCATGEEAYSLAMLVQECLDQTRRGAAPGQREVKIFATDLDDDALAIASKGVYAASIAKDLPPGRLERFFTREGEGFKVKNTIRQMLVFAHHDLAKNPPYCNIDLITCRNLLIYLNPALQKKIFSLLHFGLRQGGYLFLGSSEQAPLQELQFLEIDKKWRIYQKTSASPAIQFDAFSLPQTRERPATDPALAAVALRRAKPGIHPGQAAGCFSTRQLPGRRSAGRIGYQSLARTLPAGRRLPG